MLRHLNAIFVTSAVASLATLPFALFHFARATHYAVLGNLIAMPIMGFVVMPLAGFVSGRVDARYLIAFALALQGIALWNMSTLNSLMSFENAAMARMIQSV